RLKVVVTVTGRNIKAAPEFDFNFFVTPQEADEGDELDFTLKLINDMSPAGLEFNAADLPEGAVFDTVNARFTWTPTLLQSGRYTVAFTVSDGSFQDRKDLVILIREKDVLPKLSPVGKLTVIENRLLKVNLQAEDASGEQVGFDADGLPEGAVLYPKGLFKFRPHFDQAGDYEITFYAIDASGNTAEETVTLTVVDLNRRPELVVDNHYTGEGEQLQFTVVATDPDEDALTLSAESLPTGASFDAATGVFDWTPGQDQSGNYIVLFMASDGKEGGIDSARVVITVGNVNLPPTMDPVGNQTVAEGGELSFEVKAQDQDFTDRVSIGFAGLPDCAVVTMEPGNPVTATVALSPGYLDAGIYEVVVTATDNNAQTPLSVSRRFVLEITDVDLEPSFTGALEGPDALELEVFEGGLVEFEVSAEDPGGDPLSFSVSGLPRNARADFSLERKIVRFAPDYRQAGQHRFEVIVSDGSQAVSKEIRVDVTDVNLPPVVFKIKDQTVEKGLIINFEVNSRDPDEDSVQVYTAGRVPFLTQGDPPPAGIRDGNVFLFDTALLPEDKQISSAVFLIWAIDNRGGVSDTVRVEIAVERSDSAEVTDLAAGQTKEVAPPGFGMRAQFRNKLTRNLSWIFGFLERSGFLERAGLTALASAPDGKDKPLKGVYTFLAGDQESKFYGIRRGWGLDIRRGWGMELTEEQIAAGSDLQITLYYFDEDLPTEVPNFTEERLSVFGYDVNQETWIMMTDVTVDTELNEATFQVTDYSITEYTIGAVLDVVAPVISNLRVMIDTVALSGPTGADTTSNLAGPYGFAVNITDDEVVSSTEASLFYSYRTDEGMISVGMMMVRQSGNLFSTFIEGPLASGTTISYYFQARDSMNVVTLPVNAPDDQYTLTVLSGEPPVGVPGDVDGSGAVDIFDLLQLLKVLGGSEPVSSVSDVDVSGGTDIFDLLALLKLLSG
ncbi:MAG: putative Ig domain-containing protein, partial [Gemmatimonadota bacterium]|nr:putative Ig domain-containing protein [Gemmatimonadota bacterium]